MQHPSLATRIFCMSTRSTSKTRCSSCSSPWAGLVTWTPFVQSSLQVWDLYLQSKLWGVRPSSLLDVDDTYAAYCLDQAVFHFGSQLSAELESVEGKTAADIKRRQEVILRNWLGDDKETKGTF